MSDNEITPHLRRDIFDSSANILIADLRQRIANTLYCRQMVQAGSDFEYTITAFNRTLHAALDYLEKQVRLEIERDKQGKPTNELQPRTDRTG